MGKPLASGRSTPRYAAIFVLGVAVGTAVRAVRWVLPTGIARRVEERLLG